MAERDVENLLDQPLRRAIWRLAVPAAAALALRMVGHNVDQYWVGHLPERTAALAAVGSASFVLWMVYSAASLFNTGIQATVARAVGSRDSYYHAAAVRHGLLLAVAAGFIVGVVGYFAAPVILGFQDTSPEVRELATRYLRILFLGLPVNYLGLAYASCFRAEGDTVTPFKVLCIGPVLSFCLDPLLVSGLGPFPRMGVAGAATVNVTIQICQAMVMRWQYHSRRRHLPVPYEWSWLLRIVRIGYPLAGAGVLFSSVYVVLVKVLAPFGDAPVAALTLGHTIEGFAHFLCVGFGTAASTLVGQNLGAGRPEEAERAGYAVAAQLAWLVTPFMFGLALISKHVLGFYMDQPDPAVIYYGSQYLWVAAIAQAAMAYELVMWNAQAGAGSTWPPTCVDLVVYPSRIPLAWLFAQHFGLGPLGVWIAIGTTAFLGGIAQTMLFRLGRWKLKELR